MEKGSGKGRKFWNVGDALTWLDDQVDWSCEIAWGDRHGDKQPNRGDAEFRLVELRITDGQGVTSYAEGTGPDFCTALMHTVENVRNGVFV